MPQQATAGIRRQRREPDASRAAGAAGAPAKADKWICFDVGETLIDETRVWTTWANVLGVTPLTFMAVLGTVLAEGEDHRVTFTRLGRPDWRERYDDYRDAFGGFRADDLYPDALPALDALRAGGFSLAVVANQPAARTAELRALGVDVDVMAMSAEFGFYKPSPEFYRHTLSMIGAADPSLAAYVGDRLDNDVRPAADAGMHPVWIRRGPWAALTSEAPPAGALIVESLAELVERIGEVWA